MFTPPGPTIHIQKKKKVTKVQSAKGGRCSTTKLHLRGDSRYPRAPCTLLEKEKPGDTGQAQENRITAETATPQLWESRRNTGFPEGLRSLNFWRCSRTIWTRSWAAPVTAPRKVPVVLSSLTYSVIPWSVSGDKWMNSQCKPWNSKIIPLTFHTFNQQHKKAVYFSATLSKADNSDTI